MDLSNIVDENGENSYYCIQMTPETSISETHGPIHPKEIFESGRISRYYDQGMLYSRNVFIDEIFDARENARRNILGLLAERHDAQGAEIVKGKIETVIAAYNVYLDEVYERAGNQSPKALIDRFSFNVYVPGEFRYADSYNHILSLEQADFGERPGLQFSQLDKLRAMVGQVEIPGYVSDFLSLFSYRMKALKESIEEASQKAFKRKLQNGEYPPPPYRATKYHSPRTLLKAARLLRSIVVQEWIATGGKRPLVARIEDLQKLKNFFVLSGTDETFVESLLDRTVNPYERSQLSAILQESKEYEEVYLEIVREMNDIVYRYALVEIEGEVENATTPIEKEKLIDHLVSLYT